MRRSTYLTAVFLLAAGPAFSQAAGLIVANRDYQQMGNVSAGDQPARAARDLESAGMQLVTLSDATNAELQQGLSEFVQMAARSDKLMVVLSGQFVHSETESFFLPIDAEAGPLTTLPANALPLSTVFAYLASRPGGAVLVLATTDEVRQYDDFVAARYGDLDIPQGVTVITGEPSDITTFLRTRLSKPGQPFIQAATANRDLKVEGYAPGKLVLLTPQERTQSQPVGTNLVTNRIADIRAWRAASDENTVEAYEGYVDKFPNGEFVVMAENRIQALTDTPEARAERAEQALDLNRDARRDIQRKLTLLGFNTRGIDGIFGRGTRGAIESWQRTQGFDPTGYVARDQLQRLDQQAAARAAELEAEAEARRAQQLAEDRAYWDLTGRSGTESSLRTYLERYPDGEYSEIARQQLTEIERQKRREATALDRQLWDEATQENTARAYRDYLELSRDGAFRDEAQARIASLNAREAETNSTAARQEQALNLSPRTVQIIEKRLDALGLRPGRIDGILDDDSRRAIRRYQASRNMSETGYLSEAVVVQLLADSVRQIFR